jgi:hypothetical protein
MVISTAAGMGTWSSVGLSIVLAFGFGYGLSLGPLVRGGLPFGRALRLALAADTVSITSMEVMDNLVILIIPAAITAGLNTWLFWGSLAVSLVVAFVVTVPVNWWLIGRGQGHAVMHDHMGH